MMIYACDSHLMKRLKQIQDDLYGNGQVMTADQRRDLADRLRLLIDNLSGESMEIEP